MYVEYVFKDDLKKYKQEIKEGNIDAEKPYVRSFGDQINPGRNYLMFTCFTGYLSMFRWIMYTDLYQRVGKIKICSTIS